MYIQNSLTDLQHSRQLHIGNLMRFVIIKGNIYTNIIQEIL